MKHIKKAVFAVFGIILCFIILGTPIVILTFLFNSGWAIGIGFLIGLVLMLAFIGWAAEEFD